MDKEDTRLLSEALGQLHWLQKVLPHTNTLISDLRSLDSAVCKLEGVLTRAQHNQVQEFIDCQVVELGILHYEDRKERMFPCGKTMVI